MSILLDVGERIKAVRISEGMTQTKLAEEADSCVSHISNIENGKTEMGIEMFSRVIHALRIKADVLLPNEDIAQKDILDDSSIDFLVGDFDKKYKEITNDCTESEKYILIEMLKDNKRHIRSFTKLLDK